ncbi:MAG: CHASE domain-containing protein [Alphaproteobacteria bacterium]|nr:CHASE domain-containing protein [Alphaproteobacteria bacterium]
MASMVVARTALPSQAVNGAASKRKGALSMTWWALGVLAIMLTLTGVAYFLVRADHLRNDQQRFDFRTAEIESAIATRMDAYIEVLRGGLGLFNASTTVSRGEWQAYVRTLEIERVLPGIQGIGYAEFVRLEDRSSYEQNIRDEGFPDFRIRPDGARDLYSSITFLEPFDERNRQAFGFDMYQQETRRDGMNRARDSGSAAISGKVTLVQEINEDVQAGFLMYLPYYGQADVPASLEQRREAIRGFVYSPFRMGNLMQGILGGGLPNVRLEIFDAGAISDETLMYDSIGRQAPPSRAAFVHTSTLGIGQHRWTLRVASLPAFGESANSGEDLMLLVGGVILSLLVFGILWSFASTRGRAETLANTMTVRLQESTKELQRSNAELELFAYVASHDLKAPLRGIDHLASWIESDLGDALTGEPKQNMGLLKGRIKRLEALLDDLLDYSRAGRLETNPEPMPIENLSREWFDAVNIDGRFTFHQSIELPELTVSAVGLEQVLTNLFTNSMKHHGGDLGNIFLKVFATNGFYEIHYEDDGIGIPADQRDRAFQMFQTLQPRDKVEGSGMGMAIIRKIVEREGGTVECLDRPSGQSGVFFRIRWKKA